MSEKYPTITTIGLEGPNRVGKSTQSELLKSHFESLGIPVVVVRGDGSRSGLGKTQGDPESKTWQEIDASLRIPGGDLEEWNKSSYRIARELLVWRDRILPNIAKEAGVSDAVLLIDRTLLARTLVPREMGTPNRLYDDEMRPENPISGLKKGSVVTAESVVPDIIIQFVAPKELLLARLGDDNDEKNLLRKRLLEERYSWYLDAHNYIPAELTNRIVRINAAEDTDSVFKQILDALHERGVLND